jgi:hypothetical protein
MSVGISSCGGSKERQRREKLKSSIRVLPDGGQVMAPGSAFSSASASSFLGRGTGTGTGTTLVDHPPAAAAAAPLGPRGSGGGGFRGRLGSAPATSAAPVVESLEFDHAGVYTAGNRGRSPGLAYGQRAAASNVELGNVMGRESPRLRAGSGNGNGGEKSARSSPVPDRVRGASTPRLGPSPRGSPRPRRNDGVPSPRPSAERTRDYGYGRGGQDRGGIGSGLV